MFWHPTRTPGTHTIGINSKKAKSSGRWRVIRSELWSDLIGITRDHGGSGWHTCSARYVNKLDCDTNVCFYSVAICSLERLPLSLWDSSKQTQSMIQGRLRCAGTDRSLVVVCSPSPPWPWPSINEINRNLYFECERSLRFRNICILALQKEFDLGIS